MNLRPIATTTSDFPDLRKSGCIYVDKTAYFHRLVSDVGAKFFFFSRPRRFGKSLMITALKAIFQGRRELFDGLAISKSDWAWEKWPVIHFNFGPVDTMDVDAFDAAFVPTAVRSLEEAGYAYDEARPLSVNFGLAVDALSAANGDRGVVILIDEYDAPVSHALDRPELAVEIRRRMSSFYTVMKDRTDKIRFMMMTGVSKFTKMSVFSALNNIFDVSMDREYATMLGYTEDELTENFEEHLREHAKVMGLDYEAYRRELRRWYNGFRFSGEDATTVYSPISIAFTLHRKPRAFHATWSSTGRPSTLMNCLKRGDMRPGHLSSQRRAGGRNARGYAQLSYTFRKRSRTDYVRPEDLERIRAEHGTNDFCFHPLGESRRGVIPHETKAAITIAAFQLRRLG